MISSKVSSRRRDVAKCVASVFGIVLVLPLMGCSSQGVLLSDSGSNAYGQKTTGSVPIPSEPVYGEADSGSAPYWSSKARVPAASATGSAYKEASVQRGTLTPVSTAYAAPASNDQQGADLGGSYALQPLDAPASGQTPNASKLTYESAKRYAGPAPSYYDGEPNYRSRPDGYEPRRRAYEDKPRPEYDRGGSGDDGEYVVAPGDTMFSIAQRHGMTIVELGDINRLNGSTIHPGQRLRVRGPKYTSANKYKAPSGYEPGNRDRGGSAYADDERKAPPAYAGDRGGRYTSYSDYSKRQPKPEYGRDEEAEKREQGRTGTYSDRPYYADKQYGAEKPARSEKPYYAQKPPRSDEKAYAEKPSYVDQPPYAEQRDGEEAPPYAERQAHAGKPRYEDRPQEREPNRYARADGNEDNRADEPRYEPRRTKSKGSYQNYSVRPGDTLRDVASRNGLSDRELAEYNDIPPSARLYSG